MTDSRAKMMLVGVAVLAGAAYFFKLRSRTLTMPPEVIGIWDSGCRKAGKGHAAPWRVITELRAPDREFQDYLLYRDGYCKVPLSAMRTVAKRIFGSAKGGEMTTDGTPERFGFVILDKQIAANGRTKKFYGFSSWQVGVERDIGDRSIEPSAPILRPGNVQYDIVKVTGGGLLWGDSDTGDMMSPKTRPTELESAARLYRRIDKLPSYLPARKK